MVLNNGMLLGDGPIISGTWYNPKTGHSFTAKDTYIEDDKMYVLTTDGQRLDYNMLSQYVQSNKPALDKTDFQQRPRLSSMRPPEVSSEIITPEDNSLILEDDMKLIQDANIKQPNTEISKPASNSPVPSLGNLHTDEDSMLIRRMLSKASAPEIDIKIHWDKYPNKQMIMLDMMDVDPVKIADFYISNIDIQAIKKKVIDGIKEFVNNKKCSVPDIFNPAAPVESTPAPAEEKNPTTQPKKGKSSTKTKAKPKNSNK
jgi:hypothetical protein